MTRPLLQFLSRPPVRIGLGAAAVTAVVGVLALGAFTAGGDTGPVGGPGLNIAVVPPVERDFEPGSAMDVGDLSDGFDRAALERGPEMIDDTYTPPEAYVGDDWAPQGAGRVVMPDRDYGTPNEAYSAVVDAQPRSDALDDGSRAFGFDRPRSDYAAERAARWAAREAASAPPSGDGPVPYSQAVKYSSE